MLESANVYATIGVKDLDAAKKFYGETLGLQILEENPGGVMYQSGSGRLLVYPSEFAGTNKATYAAWEVTDLEETVEDLKAAGIEFERYDDLPDTERQGEIHTAGKLKIAWFKDPTGNILSIESTAE